VGVLHVASDCRLAVDPAAPLRESGVLDYAEAEVYNAGVLVRVDATVSTLDHISIDVVVDGAEHSLVWKWEDWPNEDVTASVAGHRATHVWLTPSALALTTAAELASGPREARKRALSTVVVHGVTTNGEPVMSEPWQYPIDLCYELPRDVSTRSTGRAARRIAAVCDQCADTTLFLDRVSVLSGLR